MTKARTVGTRALLAAGLVASAAVEALWLSRWGIASPARVLVYVVIATFIGNAALRLPRARRRVRAFDAFVTGVVVLSLVFALCVRFGGVRAFAPIAWVLGAASLAKARRSHWLDGRVPLAWVVVAPIFLLLVVRAVWFTDRLDLTVAVPSAFAWIDTPLWLSLAFGAERSVPPAELLFAGHHVNYHFGSALVLASIRRLLGMPAQTAYFGAMVVFQTALGAGLARAAAVFFRARLPARIAATFSALALLEHVTFNFPTVVALPVFVALLVLLFRLRRPVEAWPLVLGTLFLMVTKEVDYLFFFVLGGVIALVRFLKRREWLTGAVLVGAGVFTRPFYDRLIRFDQRALLRPWLDHLDGDFLRGALATESMWIVAATLVAVFAYSRRRTHRRVFLAVVAALPAFGAGLLLCWFVKPTFVPPMDAFSYGWILFDMGQFVVHAKFVLATVLALSLFAVTLSDPRARAVRLAPVTVAAFVFYALVNMWRAPGLSPDSERPENRGPDAVVPLLERVDPEQSLIAADRLNWNHENPHWAAFFGHRFFLLREGRWTTAYADYGARVEAQRTLFTTPDASVAREIATKGGITHLIASAQRPVPWLATEEPVARSGEYALYVIPGAQKP